MTDRAPGAGADLVDVERFFTHPGAVEELTHSLLGAARLGPDSHEQTEPGERTLTTAEAPTPTPTAHGATALVGRFFHGYQAVEHLGSGASAHVFRGQHRHLARGCAIKVLKPELQSNETAVRRLEREGRLLVEIRDPHFVEGYDVGLSEDGHPFVLLELLDGETLLDLILREAPLSIERACELTRQIALGLEALHRRGVVHRDLKASNVMVTRGPTGPVVKIMDLGLMVDTRTDATRLTVAAGLMGTPNFIAPEQIVDPRKVTGAADLYALGVIAFAMLARRLPYDGPNPGPLPPGELAHWGDLGRVVAQLLELEASRRPSSAREVVRALEVLGELGTEPTLAATSMLPTQTAKPETPLVRSPLPKAFTPLGAALGAVCLLGIGAALLVALRERPAAAPSIPVEVIKPLALERRPEPLVDPIPEPPPPATLDRTARHPKRSVASVAEPMAPPPIVSPPPTNPPPRALDQREAVNARLTRLRQRLKTAPPSEQWDAWEQRYLELKKQALVATAPSDWDELARSVLDLERELERSAEDR